MKEGKRVTVIGRTGSGKTIAALYLLALEDWNLKPWIIIDFKGDPAIAQIPGVTPIDIDDEIPDDPGLYKIRFFPGQEKQLDDLMRRIWAHQNVGVFFDEGYMIAGERRYSPAYRTLLTQGRSMGIDVITLTQRPVELDKFAFSEASNLQIFDLALVDDQKKVGEYVSGHDTTEPIDPYNSKWYTVNDKSLVDLGPVPPPDEIMKIFEDRQPKKREAIGEVPKEPAKVTRRAI